MRLSFGCEAVATNAARHSKTERNRVISDMAMLRQQPSVTILLSIKQPPQAGVATRLLHFHRHRHAGIAAHGES